MYAGVVSWESCGVSRVTHASFDFEAVTAVSSLDLLSNLREILGEVTISICSPRGPLQDEWRKKHSYSLTVWGWSKLGTTSSLSNRRRRDILDLRYALELDDLSAIVHVNGTTNPFDVGTKAGSSTKKAQPAAEALVEQGYYMVLCSRHLQRLPALVPMLGAYMILNKDRYAS